MKICKGAICKCSQGLLGLVTEDEPKEVTYPNGEKGTAYVGIQLTDEKSPIGSPWCSRSPEVIAYVHKGKIFKSATLYEMFQEIDKLRASALVIENDR